MRPRLQHSAASNPTFAAWITAAKHSTPNRVGDSATFLIAEVAHAADGTSLEVHLPGGAVAKATDSNQVRLIAELLRHLS